jgi:ABC-type sugar transport system substrate-binding protein
MGAHRLNGIDAAIAMLKAIIDLGGHASNNVLMDRTGLSRSSLRRIARKLADEDILTISRGRIGVGPIAKALFAADCARIRLEQTQRTARGRSAGVRVMTTPDKLEGSIPLSQPLRCDRQRQKLRVGFSNVSLDNPWRVALVHSAEYAASTLSYGIGRFTVRHADNNGERQAADIRGLVEDGVDGLIVSAIASPAVHAAIDMAMARGAEVVMVDRRLAHADPTSFVSTSDEAIGQTTALWLAETLEGRGSVLLLPGGEEAEPAQLRLAAAQRVFSRYPGIGILDVNWTGWQRNAGFVATSQAIARFGNRISGVWCDSGLQGVGSMEAFLAAGRKAGEIPPHTGGDLNLAYKLAIKHEVKFAAMDYPPAMGFRAVEVLFASLRGHYVPKRLDVATDLVLTRNAALATMKPQAWADEHVRWDLPDNLILASGLGRSYNPKIFRIHYPGNSYNRSAAAAVRGVS